MSLIKIAFAKHRLRPNRRLGQNFLIDDALLERLARIACENSALPVLEIGAGIGNFSLHLARHCAKLLVVEKDRSFEPALREALAAFPETEIIIDDFLNLDLERRACGEKFNVVGNLPFYATSAIITRLIDYRAYVDRINITVQKEVAQRLVAKPGTKDYGRLTCLVQFYTQPQIREIIPNQAFFPVPEVDAAFITLQVLPQPSVSVKSGKSFPRLSKLYSATGEKPCSTAYCPQDGTYRGRKSRKLSSRAVCHRWCGGKRCTWPLSQKLPMRYFDICHGNHSVPRLNRSLCL